MQLEKNKDDEYGMTTFSFIVCCSPSFLDEVSIDELQETSSVNLRPHGRDTIGV